MMPVSVCYVPEAESACPVGLKRHKGQKGYILNLFFTAYISMPKPSAGWQIFRLQDYQKNRGKKRKTKAEKTDKRRKNLET